MSGSEVYRVVPVDRDLVADDVDRALSGGPPPTIAAFEPAPAGSLLLFGVEIPLSRIPADRCTVRAHLGDERPTYAWDGHAQQWVLCDVVRRSEDVR